MAATTQVQILVWTWLVGVHKTYFRDMGSGSWLGSLLRVSVCRRAGVLMSRVERLRCAWGTKKTATGPLLRLCFFGRLRATLGSCCPVLPQHRANCTPTAPHMPENIVVHIV